jgi:hypothetical protein
VQTSRLLPPLLLALLAYSHAPGAALAVPPDPPPTENTALEGATSSDLSLTLGARAERGPYRSELSGFLALALPLERLLLPRSGVPAQVEDSDEAEAPADSRAGAKRADLRVVPLLSAPALSELSRASVAAGLRALRVPERRADLQGMATRSRSSALLPELRLRAARAQDESLRLTPTTEDPYRFTQDGGDDLVLEARATWKLTRLVFADEEIAIKRLELEQERGVERVSARVLALVLAWHEAASRGSSGDATTRARADFERLEAEVALDVLTGGWFGPRAARLVGARRVPVAREPEPPPASSARTGGASADRPVSASSDLVEPGRSATSAEPCLPMHETASKTFSGVSMR